MAIGREMFIVAALVFGASLADAGDVGPGDEILTLSRSFRERLAFRPSEAKKPAPLVEGVGAKERRDDGGVPLPTLELERAGWLRGGFMAKEGYGRVGGRPGGVISR